MDNMNYKIMFMYIQHSSMYRTGTYNFMTISSGHSTYPLLLQCPTMGLYTSVWGISFVQGVSQWDTQLGKRVAKICKSQLH